MPRPTVLVDPRPGAQMIRRVILAAMLAALSASAVAQQHIPAPRGPNNSVIGAYEHFRVRGPQRLCFIQAGFDLQAGETAYLAYLGLHWASLRVIGPGGEFVIAEGNAWAEPRRHGRIVPDVDGRHIVLRRRLGAPIYWIYGRPDFEPDREQPLVRVDGDALTGGRGDADILSRIRLLPDLDSCRQRFVYGFNSD